MELPCFHTSAGMPSAHADLYGSLGSTRQAQPPVVLVPCQLFRWGIFVGNDLVFVGLKGFQYLEMSGSVSSIFHVWRYYQ